MLIVTFFMIPALREETVWGGGLFVFYHIFAFLEDAKDRLNLPDYNRLFVHKILHRLDFNCSF